MKLRYCAFIAVLSIVFAIGLGACSSSGGAPSAASSEGPAVTSGTFEGRELRDAGELDEYVDHAIENAELVKAGSESADAAGEASSNSASGSSESSDGSGPTENEENGKVSDQFANANALYREGDYAGAESGYQEVLNAYPKHFGANVNITLAKLQQQKNDDALVQALTCHALFPDDEGCMLNAQAAGVACGFGTGDVEDAARRIEDAVGSSLAIDHLNNGVSEYADYYKYNTLWSGLDQGLYMVNKGDMTYEQGLADLIDELKDIDEFENDEQAAQLLAYAYATMRQLGMA